MEKMILTKVQLNINRFTKIFNQSCNMAVPVFIDGKKFFLMFRIEQCDFTPTEVINLN